MATGLETLRRNAPDYSGSVAIKSMLHRERNASDGGGLRFSQGFHALIIMYYRMATFQAVNENFSVFLTMLVKVTPPSAPF